MLAKLDDFPNFDKKVKSIEVMIAWRKKKTGKEYKLHTSGHFCVKEKNPAFLKIK